MVDVAKEIFDAEAITVMAPADIGGKTYTWLVSSDQTNWATLQDTSAANIAVPAASQAIIYNGFLTAFPYLQLKASSAVGADITFTWYKSFRS